MNIYTHYAEAIAGIIAELGLVDVPPAVHCESPRNPKHGDLATNIALVLAKPMGKLPMVVAEMLAPHIEKLEGVEACAVAKPGFINLGLAPSVWQARIADIIDAGEAWGACALGKGKRVNVEFVSANPTGPLHAAHARGAVIGDSLAHILAFCGYEVSREYYVNDAGGQIDDLALSLIDRMIELRGESINIDKMKYPGEYLIPIAKKLKAIQGESNLDDDWKIDTASAEFVIKEIMDSIQTDLKQLGIDMDDYVYESKFLRGGQATTTIMDALEAKGLVYWGIPEKPKSGNLGDWQARKQLLFATTRFGDDQDRPLAKADNSPTYFASDMAYHRDKLSRNYDILIDVWGADHAGYVKRMQAAVAALKHIGGRGIKASAELHIVLVQLVKLMDKGKPVKMSKRAGNFITLAEMLAAVGAEVIRFTMLTRRHDQHLEFDYAKVTEQSKDNPVFYVQYAHARAASVLRQEGAGDIMKQGTRPNLAGLTDTAELTLIKQLASFPRVVALAAKHYEPHRIAFALGEIAADFHALYNKGRDVPSLRFISDDKEATHARLQLVAATKIVLANGLRLLGITGREDM